MISSMLNFVNQPVCVLDVIDLVEVDDSMTNLYNRLLLLKQDYYNSNEKIVILHNDTEYTYFGNPLGFTMHNLFRCWQALDIPYSVMVIVTNHSDINLAVQKFIVDDKDQPTVINCIVNNVSYSNIKHLINVTTSKTIRFPALALLGIGRSHRIKLFQYLTCHSLFEKIKTNFKIYSPTTVVAQVPGQKLPFDQIYTAPHRTNETCFTHSKIDEIVELSKIPVLPKFDPNLDGDLEDFYNQFFLDVVTETVFDYPHQYVSEKILRPLLMKTPFVLFGPAGTLQYLKNHGFKTFENFWDESYDIEKNPHLRFLKCCNIIKFIADQPVDILIEWYQSMTPILIHNRQVLLDYVNTSFYPLYKKINFDL